MAILDAAGNEIIRHGASGFLGELNLLSGQTVFVTAVVTQPLRYIAVDRDALRALLFEDGPLSDLVLSTFIVAPRGAAARRRASASRSSGRARPRRRMRLLDFVRANRLPFTWHDESPPSGVGAAAGAAARRRRAASTRRSGERAARARDRPRARRRARRSTCWSSAPARPGSPRPCTAPPRGSTRSIVESTALGGQAGSSRRIENYLGFPAGISGTELTEPGRVSQARKFGARPATPYRAIGLEPGDGRHVVRLEEDHEIAARAVILATGAEYRRLPVDDLADYEGTERLLRGRPARGAAVRRLPGGRRRRRQLGRPGRRLAGPRRRARHAAASPRRPARDDVRLPDPRARALRRRRSATAARSPSCTAPTDASRRSR